MLELRKSLHNSIPLAMIIPSHVAITAAAIQATMDLETIWAKIPTVL